MISFCLGDPFIESALKRYNETLTGEMYVFMNQIDWATLIKESNCWKYIT